MRRKFKSKTAMGFFRRKSIAIFMALLMFPPYTSFGVSTSSNSVSNSNYENRPGAIKNGKVDLASGNVAFMKNLFDLKGYKLTLKYNTEGVKDEVSVRNQDAHSGVIGVGWKLSKDRIVRLTHQTANTTDDEYLLNAHGKISKLTFEYESGDTLHFRLHSNPYWKIIHLENQDQWVIQKQNGNEYTYGDGSLIDHEANSTEKSIVWDNWVGSSIVEEGRDLLTTAWNLSAIENMYGEQVTLFYENEEESVGANADLAKYTKASYLSKVVDMDGNYIELNYEEKNSYEYRDPHIENTLSSEQNDYDVAAPSGDDDRDAFQERFERKYLSSVARKSYADVLDRKIELKYQLSAHDNYMKKRFLTEIQYVNQHGSFYQPSTLYDYYGLEESDGVSVGLIYEDTELFNSDQGAFYGALKSITIPGGGTNIFKYDKVEIEDSARDFDIPFPADFTYKNEEGHHVSVGWRAPKLFFMNDYVVVLHESNNYDRKKTNVSICTWIGHKWVYQDMGIHEGVFYDRYHAEDYHIKNMISTLKDALLEGIATNVPLVGGLMNAFNDAITDEINTQYTVAQDLAEGDITGAVEDLINGDMEMIKDIAKDMFASLEDTFDDFDNTISDIFGTKSNKQQQQQLAEEEEEYNAKNPRKEYHIALEKDFFALTTSTANSSATQYNQDVYIFEKDKLVDGNWAKSALPVFITTKYIKVDSGNDFVVVFDEVSDVFFTFTRHRHRYWTADFNRINQVVTRDETLEMEQITAMAENDILNAFGNFSGEDKDFLKLLATNKRSDIAANNNFIVIVTSQADGSKAKVQLFHHNKNKSWNWSSPAINIFDKTLIPEDVAGGLENISQGLAPNSLLQLKAGNAMAGLQVYDNLDMEIYNDVMSGLFGGVGTTDGSTNALNPLSTIQNDFVQDLSAMNATYGIVWDKDMSNLSVKLLHAAVGQTGVKMYVNGNVIQKIGKAYSLLIGAQQFDDNGINYAFRYDGEKFISNSFESDYFSSAMAPDVASQVVESSDKTKKTPKFHQYYANRPVDGDDFVSVSTLGDIDSDEGELQSYNAAGLLMNVPSDDSWSLISNASQEEINAPEFVKEAIHVATDIVNLIIQVIMMVIPFAQEFAIAEEVISIIDKVVQVAGMAMMVVQPAADALVDRIMGVNHKSTSIANNYISTNGKLFSRQTDGSWSALGQAFDLHGDDKLVGTTNDLSNGYYNYTVKREHSFEDPANNNESTHIQSYLAILKNGEIYRSMPFNQYADGHLMVARRDSVTMTSGNNVFVSYGPINSDGYVKRNDDIIRPNAENREERRRKQSYEDATHIRLHRLADDEATGKLHDYVVRTIETNDGYASTYQHYDYDTETASFNSSHGAAVYPRVVVYPSNQAEFERPDQIYLNDFGANVYYFYNNQNFYGGTAQGYPANVEMPTEDELVTYEYFDHRDIADFNHHGLTTLHGRQYMTEIYQNQESTPVSRTINCHVVYVHDFFHRSSVLELDHVYQPLQSAKISMLDGVVNRTVNRYTNDYDATLLRTVEHYSTNANGNEEIYYTSKRYAFEHYPKLLDQNRISEVYQVIDSVKHGNQVYVTGAHVTSYKKWTINGSSVWAPEKTYEANLDDDILDPEELNYISKGAEEVALQDKDFSDFDALLSAYELEIGNYHEAYEAVIGASKAAADSYSELVTTRQELVNAQYELQKTAADLSESNEQLDDAKDEAEEAYKTWQDLEKKYLKAEDDVDDAYDDWQDQLYEKSWMVPLAFVTGGPIAGIIVEKREKHKVHEKYQTYQNAIATKDALEEAAKTASDNYQELEDIYEYLDSEHESVVNGIKRANLELKDAITAFELAYAYSSEAKESAILAIHNSSAMDRDHTSDAHNVSITNQNEAIFKHEDYTDEAYNALKALVGIKLDASKYKKVKEQTVSYTGQNGNISSSWSGDIEDNYELIPYTADFNDDGIHDLLMKVKTSSGWKLRLFPGTASSVDNLSFGNALTSYDVNIHYSDHITVLPLRKDVVRFREGTGLDLIKYTSEGRSIHRLSFTESWSNNFFSEGSISNRSEDFIAGDFDGNGKDDYMVRGKNFGWYHEDYPPNKLQKIIYNIHPGSSGASNVPDWVVSTLGSSENRMTGDFNGDGRDDVFARYTSYNSYDQAGRFFFASGYRNFVGADTYNFTPLFSDVDDYPAGDEIRVFDINQDGLDDLFRINFDSTDDGDTEMFANLSVHEDGEYQEVSVRKMSKESFSFPNSNNAKHFTVTDFDPTDFKIDLHFIYHVQNGNGGNFHFVTHRLVVDDAYLSVGEDIDNAIDDLVSTMKKHDDHIGNLEDLTDQHEDIIEKVRTLSVKAEDIDTLKGNTYKWFKTNSILKRDEKTGAPVTTADARNVKSSHLIDTEGRHVIASIVDSDFSEGEAMYLGFEDYEDIDRLKAKPGSGTSYVLSESSGSSEQISESKAHTGKQSVRVRHSNLKIQPAAFQPNPAISYADTAYVISAFVKKTSGAKVWVGADTLSYAHAASQAKAKNSSKWQYIEGVVIGSDLINGKIPTIHVNSSSWVYIDDVTIRPLAAPFSATVFNDLGQPIAEIDNNGLTKRMHYDSHHQLSSIIDDTGRIYGLNLSGYSRDQSENGLFDAANPNESTKFSFMNLAQRYKVPSNRKYSGSLNSTFYTGTQHYVPHDLDSNDILYSFSIVPENTDEIYAEFNIAGAEITVSSSEVTVSGSQGGASGSGYLSTGGTSLSDALSSLTNGNSNVSSISISSGSSSNSNSLAGSPVQSSDEEEEIVEEEVSSVPLDYTLAVISNQLLVWMDGKLHTQMNVNSSSRNLSWQITDGYMKEVIKAKDPVLKMEFTNGIGQHLQTIRPLFNNDGEYYGKQVKAILYDGWGHSAVSTLPMFTDDTDLVYEASAVTVFDWDSGIMQGDIADYYENDAPIIDMQTDDHKYPYFRTYYMDYPISRVQKKNKPGQDFYATEEDNSSSMDYQSADGDDLLTNQFNLGDTDLHTTQKTSSMGHETISVTDKMGNKVITQKGDAISQKVMTYTSEGYRADTIRTPNYFANEDPEDGIWYTSVHAQEDMLSLSDVNESPDRGKVGIIKDQLAKVAFIKPASSTATEDAFGQLKFYQYDEQERVIAQGLYSARWDRDRLSTISKTSYWHDNDLDWTKVFKYDIDSEGNTLYNKGKTTQTIHRNGEAYVYSDFDYNIYGQIVENCLGIYNPDHVLLANYEISYQYYPTGQVRKITYADGFEVIYTFNRQGKLHQIGTADEPSLFATYTYDELDRLVSETRKNGELASINLYDLRGRNKDTRWLKNDNDTIFKQELEFFRDGEYFDTKIAQIKYGGSAYSDIKYDFTYDSQDRLKQSVRVMNEGEALESTATTNYTFDKNSNITSYHDDSKLSAVEFDYKEGTNQDLMSDQEVYNADGLKTRFDSKLWGEDTFIEYNLFSNKAQLIFESDRNVESVHRGIWYKLAPSEYRTEVLGIELGTKVKPEEGSKVISERPRSVNSQLFRFVKSEYSNSYHIKVRANESLNLHYQADKGFYLDQASGEDALNEDGSSAKYNDDFTISDDGNNNLVIGHLNAQSDERITIQEDDGVHQLVMTTVSGDGSDQAHFIALPVEIAKPSDNYMMFHYDAKNNKVMKSRDFIDANGVHKQDHLVYVHGNNRLPLSEVFVGTETDESGDVDKKAMVSDYIYGPGFGSIGMRSLSLDADIYDLALISQALGDHEIVDHALPASDDSFVRGGSYKNNTHGNHAVATIKGSNNISYERRSFFKFDVSNVESPDKLLNMDLNLHVEYANNKAKDAKYHIYLMNHDWDEETKSWANSAFNTSTLIYSADGLSSGDHIRVDLSGMVEDILLYDHVTFGVKCETIGTNAYVNLRTKESSDTGKHPKLTIRGLNGVETEEEGSFSEVKFPTADTYVRGGSYANNNFGSSETLTVKHQNNSPSYTRYAYFKFDVSDIDHTTDLSLAKLKIHVASAEDGINDAEFKAYLMDGDWNESSIKWNNSSFSTGRLIDELSDIHVGHYVDIDLTDHADYIRDNDEITIGIKGFTKGNYWMNFTSKESSNDNLHPRLILRGNEYHFTKTMNASEDMYVRAGTYHELLVQNDDALLVKYNNDISYRRRAYVKFDVSSIHRNNFLTSAKLRLYVKSATDNINSADMKFYIVNDNWNESSTWSNVSFETNKYVSSLPYVQVGDYIYIDLTDYKKHITDNEDLSIGIRSYTHGNGHVAVTFGCSEDSDANKRPKLILQGN